MRFPLENPNSKAATSPPMSPVIPPIKGPPKRAAMNVVRWERSRARETVTGPSGIEGIIGASWMEMKDRTLPRAAIIATNMRVFDLNLSVILTLFTTTLTKIKVTTKK